MIITFGRCDAALSLCTCGLAGQDLAILQPGGLDLQDDAAAEFRARKLARDLKKGTQFHPVGWTLVVHQGEREVCFVHVRPYEPETRDMLNLKSNIGYAIMLAYILGNALTYNYLAKLGADVPGDRFVTTMKNLLTATVWPLYWLARAAAS